MRLTLAVAVAVGLMLVPNPGSAQTRDSALSDVIGQRVRVWTADGRNVEGTLEAVDGGTATLELTDDIGLTSREVLQVVRAQVSVGRERRVAAGALLGMAGGAAVFGFLSAAGGEETGGCYAAPCGTAQSALLGAIVGLPIGIVFAPKSEVWAELGLPGTSRAGPQVSREGLLGIVVRIPFS